MNTSMGLRDALFGEKVSFDLPQPDGTTKKVPVTKRWMEEMVRLGKIREVTAAMVKVNVLDADPELPGESADLDELWNALSTGVQVRVEHWQVGVDVQQETYTKFVDPSSGELHAVRRKEEGQVKTVVMQRGLWEQARQAIEGL